MGKEANGQRGTRAKGHEGKDEQGKWNKLRSTRAKGHKSKEVHNDKGAQGQRGTGEKGEWDTRTVMAFVVSPPFD